MGKKIMQYGRHGLYKESFLHADTNKMKNRAEEDDSGEIRDLCPVCTEDLYHSDDVTKRIAILNNSNTDVTGWVCPECFTEFDMKDNIKVLYSKSVIQGET